MAAIPLYCERCSTLRAVETWRETSPQTLAIALSPCGHEQERTARLEWLESRGPARHRAAVTWIGCARGRRLAPLPSSSAAASARRRSAGR